LHEAAREGSRTRIEQCLREGASAGASDPLFGGFTPLHWAALNGKTKAIRALVAGGADPSAQARKGEAPLHFAAGRGHVNAVTMLVKLGAVVAVQDKRGDTPLHLAAEVGSEEACAMLLAGGADPRLTNKAGKAAIDRARWKGHVRVVKLLEWGFSRVMAEEALGGGVSSKDEAEEESRDEGDDGLDSVEVVQKDGAEHSNPEAEQRRGCFGIS
jgi:cytohesin